MGEKLPINLAYNGGFHVIVGFLTCRKSATWDRRLYFPSKGRHVEDFLALKTPTASAGFETANLGTRGKLSVTLVMF
jgi:hypothetical protein